MIGSVAEWGRRHKISKQAAHKRIKAHGIPFVANGKIDFEAADRIWSASQNPRQVLRGTSDKPRPAFSESQVSTLAATQLRRELVRLEKEMIELQKLKREVVKVADVKHAVAEMISRARERLLSIGSQLSDRLAACSEARECQVLVDEQILRALIDLSNFRIEAAD